MGEIAEGCIMVRSVDELRDYAKKFEVYINDKEVFLEDWLKKVNEINSKYVEYLRDYIEDTIDYYLEVATRDAVSRRKDTTNNKRQLVVTTDIVYTKDDVESIINSFERNRNEFDLGFLLVRPEELGYGDLGIDRKEYLWYLFKHVLYDIQRKMNDLGYKCELGFSDDDVLIVVAAVL